MCLSPVSISTVPHSSSQCLQTRKWISTSYNLGAFRLPFFFTGSWDEITCKPSKRGISFLEHFGTLGHQVWWFSKPDVLGAHLSSVDPWARVVNVDCYMIAKFYSSILKQCCSIPLLISHLTGISEAFPKLDFMLEWITCFLCSSLSFIPLKRP